MKIISGTAILIAVLLISVPAQAMGKPDHANGGGKPGDDSSDQPELSVCIDAGHGGSDPGTSNQEYVESKLNLDVAEQLKILLLANGYEAHMTRTEYSQTLSNNDRYSFCNSTNASSLISIHHNGSTDTEIDYSLGLYHKGRGLVLASTVGKSVAEEFGQASTFRVDRFPSGVLIKSDMPSMMSEGYFLTNQTRLSQLRDDYSGMVLREATSLFNGISSYYSN